MDDQREARDEALDRVSSAAGNEWWKPYALKAVYEAACLKLEITSDDVWRILHERGIRDPKENRVMGPVMIEAQKRGYVTQTDRTKISNDPASPNHSRPQRVYASLVTGHVLPSWERKPIGHSSFTRVAEYRQDLPDGYSAEKIADLDDGGVIIGIRDHRPPPGAADPGMEGRPFPLRRNDDGTVEVVTSTCPDCGDTYSVEREHRQTYRHRQAVAKAQTIEGQTEIEVPPQPPITRFTEMPKRVAFGDILLCPSCKGTFRNHPKTKTRAAYRQDFTSNMHKPLEPCLRCGGVGVIPNQGPVAPSE